MSTQSLRGAYNAQACGGSTAIVNVFQAAPAREPRDEATLTAAEGLLAKLPTDSLPSLSPLPGGSYIAFPSNPAFVGRTDDFRRLAEVLKAGGDVAVGQVAAATGWGGIGKTQLASEFAHRYGQFFAGGVFWLSFADPESVAAEVARCGGPGRLSLAPEYDSLSLAEQIALVASEWQSPLPRLLIFDNCEDEALLGAWRPRAGGCRVLVTSRRLAWGLGVETVQLGVLARAESVALLRKHRPTLGEDTEPILDTLADELGDLPLALHLAGSHLRRYRHDAIGAPSAYLAALQQAVPMDHDSLQSEDGTPTEHASHVGRTFAVSYTQLDQDNPVDALALAALGRAACFAPGEPIPRALLGKTLEEAEEGRIADALLRLSNDLGLLLVEEEGGGLVIHRLIAHFVRQQVENFAPNEEAAEKSVVEEASRLNQAGYPAPLLAWQPHLRAVAERAAARGSVEAGRLCNELGYHLKTIADYPGARVAFQRALAIVETAYGKGHPAMAVCINNLSSVLRAEGDLAGARKACEWALAIDEATYGKDHPTVAIHVNNLGNVLKDEGDLAGARKAYERALAIDEVTYGKGHSTVATRVNNLGGVLQAEGDLAGAREAYERALAIDEATNGKDHPNVARDVSNLGSVLQAEGDLAGARKAYERALAIDEATFGKDHPNVAIRVNALGSLLKAEGDLAGAHEAFERALAIDEATFGKDHPNVAIRVNNLGGVLQAEGDLAGAHEAFERALAIDEATFGKDHPNVARDVNNLGSVLRAEGDLADARKAYGRALAIFTSYLGEAHPSTVVVLNNLRSLGDSTTH